MKKNRQFVSLLLALALALSFAVLPASAAAVRDDPWEAVLLAAEDYEIRCTEDGSAMILIATLPAGEPLPAAYAAGYSSSDPEYGTAEWNNPSERTFRCRNGQGKNCRLAVDNLADSTCSLKVEYDYYINGEDASTYDIVEPGKRSVVLIKSRDDRDLTCSIDITMTPYRGLSAKWSYEGDQY